MCSEEGHLCHPLLITQAKRNTHCSTEQELLKLQTHADRLRRGLSLLSQQCCVDDLQCAPALLWGVVGAPVLHSTPAATPASNTATAAVLWPQPLVLALLLILLATFHPCRPCQSCQAATIIAHELQHMSSTAAPACWLAAAGAISPASLASRSLWCVIVTGPGTITSTCCC